jgi:uncharacterized protein RhaS with RHS repeats
MPALPSGLLQLGARFYWPELGRFLQQDPIGDGMNWYAYAGGNPVRYVDPYGLFELFAVAEGELATPFVGVDFSLLGTIDFSHGWESGFYKSQGPAFGLSAGAGYGGGLAFRDVEGEALNFDINADIASGTLSWDDHGFNAIALTKGPGMGAAWSQTNTTPVLTLGQIRDGIKSAGRWLWRQTPWGGNHCR